MGSEGGGGSGQWTGGRVVRTVPGAASFTSYKSAQQVSAHSTDKETEAHKKSLLCLRASSQPNPGLSGLAWRGGILTGQGKGSE